MSLILRSITYVALVPLFLCGCSHEVSYREFSVNAPSLKGDNGRLILYGTNIEYIPSWSGSWGTQYDASSIAINGQNIRIPQGHNIFFYIDLPAGEHTITTDEEHPHKITIEKGRTHFYEMQVQRTLSNKYWLRLLKVDPGYAKQRIMEMVYKGITQEDREN